MKKVKNQKKRKKSNSISVVPYAIIITTPLGNPTRKSEVEILVLKYFESM